MEMHFLLINRKRVLYLFQRFDFVTLTFFRGYRILNLIQEFYLKFKLEAGSQ